MVCVSGSYGGQVHMEVLSKKEPKIDRDLVIAYGHAKRILRRIGHLFTMTM